MGDPVGDREEYGGPRSAGDQHPARDRRPALDQPGDRRDRDRSGDPVREWQTEHPADRHLPDAHDPRPEQPPRPAQADTACRESDRQRDPAARDHLQVPVLLQPVGRVRERRARDRGSDRAQPQLAREQIGAEERQRVGEEEEQVVADHRRVRPAADDPSGRVADQCIAEGQRVLERPEAVGVEEVKWLVEQRVAAPGRLPGLGQRVADVARNHAAEVDQQGPGHHDREQ